MIKVYNLNGFRSSFIAEITVKLGKDTKTLYDIQTDNCTLNS